MMPRLCRPGLNWPYATLMRCVSVCVGAYAASDEMTVIGSVFPAGKQRFCCVPPTLVTTVETATDESATMSSAAAPVGEQPIDRTNRDACAGTVIGSKPLQILSPIGIRRAIVTVCAESLEL